MDYTKPSHLRMRGLLLAFLLVLQGLASAAQPVLPEGLPEPVIPQGFGINIHFVEPETRSMERISEGGYSFARMDLKWERVERERGIYDFSTYDKLTDAMRERRVRMLYILDYSNTLYGDGLAPRTEETRAAFVRFAVAAVKHFSGRGVVWEIWNEPNNTQFWKPAVNVDEYSLLAIRAARAMHAAEPKACILAPASSTISLTYLEAAFRHGLLHEIDGVSVHPYRESTPESVIEDYTRLRQLIAIYTRPSDPQRPIICSEWGYATYDANNGFSKEIQAAYLVRSWLSNLVAGVNLSIYYDLRDDGVDPTDREHHFGVLNNDLTPKPAFDAAKALIQDLRGYRFLHRLSRPAANDWALLFRRGKALAVVAWNSDIHASVKEQTPVVRLIHPADAGYDDLQRTANIGYAASALSPNPHSPAHLPITLENPYQANAEIRVQIGTQIRTLRLKPQEKQRHVFNLPINLAPDTLTSIPVRVSWNGRAVAGLPPVTIAPAYPLRLLAEPVKDGVRIVVENRLNVPTEGVLHLVSATGEKRTPLNIAAGDSQHVSVTVDSKQPVSGFVVSTKGVKLAFLKPVHFVPLPDFPTTLTDPVPFTAVEYFKEVADPKGTLVATAAGPDAPAPLALTVPYRSGARRLYTQVIPTKNLTIPENAIDLTMWVYASGDGAPLNARFKDSTGQVFQYRIGPANWVGWKLVHIPFFGTGTEGWGGARDNIPHAPLTWISLVLVDGNQEPAGQHKILVAAPHYTLKN